MKTKILILCMALIFIGCSSKEAIYLPDAPSGLKTSYSPIPLLDGKGGTMLTTLLESAKTIQACEASRDGWETFYEQIREKTNTIKPSN